MTELAKMLSQEPEFSTSEPTAHLTPPEILQPRLINNIIMQFLHKPSKKKKKVYSNQEQ